MAGNEQEALVHERAQGRRIGKDVVVGEDEEVVAVVLVPLRNVLRGRIAVAVRRVGVGVALVPAAGPPGNVEDGLPCEGIWPVIVRVRGAA